MAASPVLISASILAADLGKLQAEVNSVSSADWLQIDVMDGHFVPNLTFGAPLLRSIKTKLLLDIHLMVTNPADRIEEFVKVGAGNISFHAEAVKDDKDRIALIDHIHRNKCRASIAINPETSVDEIAGVLDKVDMVLVMSVRPGFSGQDFVESVLEKTKAIRASHPNLMIQMDGGINDTTAPRCIEAGADNLVAATYIFAQADRAAAIFSLRS